MKTRKTATATATATGTSVKVVNLMFRAFSDHTRLRILSLLSRGELCVCDITAILDQSQPKVSRHLAYLRRAGLVRARREGLWMHYQLAQASNAFHKNLLHCLDRCFADVPDLSRDRAALDQRGCCNGKQGQCE